MKYATSTTRIAKTASRRPNLSCLERADPSLASWTFAVPESTQEPVALIDAPLYSNGKYYTRGTLITLEYCSPVQVVVMCRDIQPHIRDSVLLIESNGVTAPQVESAYVRPSRPNQHCSQSWGLTLYGPVMVGLVFSDDVSQSIAPSLCSSQLRSMIDIAFAHLPAAYSPLVNPVVGRYPPLPPGQKLDLVTQFFVDDPSETRRRCKLAKQTVTFWKSIINAQNKQSTTTPTFSFLAQSPVLSFSRSPPSKAPRSSLKTSDWVLQKNK